MLLRHTVKAEFQSAATITAVFGRLVSAGLGPTQGGFGWYRFIVHQPLTPSAGTQTLRSRRSHGGRSRQSQTDTQIEKQRSVWPIPPLKLRAVVLKPVCARVDRLQLRKSIYVRLRATGPPGSTGNPRLRCNRTVPHTPSQALIEAGFSFPSARPHWPCMSFCMCACMCVCLYKFTV